MSLTMSSYDLPADVFMEGETRPVRAKKSKAAANNKRSFADSGLDVRDRDQAENKLPRLHRG